jgi:uncharacterized protein (DUF2236 family)
VISAVGTPASAEPFVALGSIVRRVWGDADAVLLVFAGAAAEFALNRAVDWLFFTGAIPSDPIGRLFRTAAYAQDIVFASRGTAADAFARIRAAHEAVEHSRGARIPDWAYRDVLYMLIDYSERAAALLDGTLTAAQRDELYDVFRRVGDGLAIPALPATYADWRLDRDRHLRRDLTFTAYTAELYARYRAQLGPWRHYLLRQLQAVLAPPLVRDLLRLPRARWPRHALRAYRALRPLGVSRAARLALVPRRYLGLVDGLNRADCGLRTRASGCSY